MTKAPSVAKERSAKSSKLKSQRSADSESVTAEESSSLVSPPPSCSDWDDKDIHQEKWSTKHPYEDPDPPLELPKSLRGTVPIMKRPSEFLRPIPENGSTATFSLYRDAAPGAGVVLIPNFPCPGYVFDQNLVRAGGNASLGHKMSQEYSTPIIDDDTDNSKIQERVFNFLRAHQYSESTSALVHANRHLLESDLMVSIISAVEFLIEHSKSVSGTGANQSLSNNSAIPAAGVAGTPNEFALPQPWDLIYPKNPKDGLPMFNSSGKYAVKLWWMGGWKRVNIDDRIPFDENGRPLLPCSPYGHEIWPMLLAKALLKIAAISYVENEYANERGDFSPLHALCGWLPEKITLIPKDIPSSFQVLSVITGRAAQQNDDGKQSEQLYCDNPIARSTSAGTRPLNIALIEDEDFLYGSRCKILETREVRIKSGEDRTVRFIKLRGSLARVNIFPREDIAKFLEDDTQSNLNQDVFWLSAASFASIFRTICSYHNPSNFRYQKSIYNLPELNKDSNVDVFRAPPILFVKEGVKGAAIFCTLTSYGRITGDSTSASIASVMLEEYDWTTIVPKMSCFRVVSNCVTTRVLRISNSAKAFKILPVATNGFMLTFHSQEEFMVDEESKYLQEVLHVNVRDEVATYSLQQANTWFFLLKQSINIVEKTFLAVQLFLQDEVVQAYHSIRIIDNDSNQELPSCFGKVKPCSIAPNKEGYSILIDCKAPTLINAGKWKLRIITTPNPLPPTTLRELVPQPSLLSLNGQYSPNRYNILFRYILKVKEGDSNRLSMQLSFGSTVQVELKVYDNDQLISAAKGKTSVTLYSVTVRGGSDNNHKYIVQGTIESTDSTKNKASNRLTSVEDELANIRRKSANTGSAKRKKTGANSDNVSVANGDAGNSENTWKLSIYSSEESSILANKDTEKEDRYKAVKASWEIQQAGRAAKAKIARENYLRAKLSDFADNPSALPGGEASGRTTGTSALSGVTSASATIAVGILPEIGGLNAQQGAPVPQDRIDTNSSMPRSARVLTPQDKLERESERNKLLLSHLQSWEKRKEMREQDRSLRVLIKNLQLDIIERKYASFLQQREEDIQLRETYRAKILQAREAQEAAMKAAETAAAQAAQAAEQQAASISQTAGTANAEAKDSMKDKEGKGSASGANAKKKGKK